MDSEHKIRVVLDTNVVFEGLTKQGGIAGSIINAWFANQITVCVTTAIPYEYEEVLKRMLSQMRTGDALYALDFLLASAEPVTIYYRYRPISPDPDDDLFIDCALNANAILVTSNVKYFRWAEQRWGLQFRNSEQFLELLLAS